MCEIDERDSNEPTTAAEAWFAELQRLIGEAEERFERGEIRPAIASLAAIPTVNAVLLEECGERLHETDADAGSDTHTGMYL